VGFGLFNYWRRRHPGPHRPTLPQFSSLAAMFSLCSSLRTASRPVNRSGIAKRLISTTPRRYADPWPLPHTPEHMASTTSPSDLPPPAPLERPNESIEVTRARLVYQSRKRGTLESDLLLSTFARDHLGGMNHEELKEFDKVRWRRAYDYRSASNSFLALGWTRLGHLLLGNRETDTSGALGQLFFVGKTSNSCSQRRKSCPKDAKSVVNCNGWDLTEVIHSFVTIPRVYHCCSEGTRTSRRIVQIQCTMIIFPENSTLYPSWWDSHSSLIGCSVQIQRNRISFAE